MREYLTFRGHDTPPGASRARTTEHTLKIQLQWYPQSQIAEYRVYLNDVEDEDYFEEETNEYHEAKEKFEQHVEEWKEDWNDNTKWSYKISERYDLISSKTTENTGVIPRVVETTFKLIEKGVRRSF